MKQARRKLSRTEWKKVIRDWEGSGLSQKEYCKRNDLSRHTFSWWKWQLSKRPPRGRPPAFVEVAVPEAEVERVRTVCTEALEVQVRNGVVVRIPRGFDENTLVRFMNVLLEARAC